MNTPPEELELLAPIAVQPGWKQRFELAQAFALVKHQYSADCAPLALFPWRPPCSVIKGPALRNEPVEPFG